MNNELSLRCFAQKVEGKWQAYCLDLTLASEADTFEAARNKLNQQIAHYVSDAVHGPDKAFAKQLLNRPAPLRYWLKYYLIKFKTKLQSLHVINSQTARAFPLRPSLLA